MWSFAPDAIRTDAQISVSHDGTSVRPLACNFRWNRSLLRLPHETPQSRRCADGLSRCFHWKRNGTRRRPLRQLPAQVLVRQLRSGKGPCCSDADGSAVADVDWESKDGHYRVRLEGQWIDVPDDAVITVPNRFGRTMVWPIKGHAGISIRCFLPGSMTWMDILDTGVPQHDVTIRHWTASGCRANHRKTRDIRVQRMGWAA